MKKRGFFLLTMLLLSSILIGLLGTFLKYHVLEPLGIHREESVMALPFLVLADEKLSYSITVNLNRLTNPIVPTETTAPPETTVPPTTVPPTTVPPTTVPPTTVPPTEPEPTYAAVEESWFNDVLFIGDSRTVGLRDYARLGEADYFCATSMSVFTVLKWTSSDTAFTDKTLAEVLTENTYGKVYIHLGLNEAGEDPDLIMQKYQELVALVQEKQPNAVIILQAIMSITRAKASDPYFALEKVQNLNTRIQELAQGDQFRFEDVNTWIADEEGYMREEMTFDGCHLYGTGYMEWRNWILENAGWHGIP